MKLLKPTLLALACALLLAGLNQQTRGVISENQRYFEQKLLRDLVAPVTASPDIIETQDGFEVSSDETLVAYIKRVTTTQGYNGDISMLVAYTPGNQVISIRVTRHRETPGIGDKIDIAVSPWINQFKGTDGNTVWFLAPTGDIDGITGATITSRAVTQAISEVIIQ